jgi:DNA-binding SARP family transcriptional activator
MSSSGMTEVERPTIPVWGRALLALAAGAGLTLLALLRPALPVMPWQPLQPTGTELLRETGWVVVWLLLLLACGRLACLAAWPPRERHQVPRHRASWLPPPRREQIQRRPVSASPLVALFSRPQPTGADMPATEADPPSVADTATRVDGRVRVMVVGRQLIGPDRRVARERATRGLIAYLAIKRAPATLEELCEALWPGEELDRTRQRLWKATRQARRLLGDVLIRERDSYWLDRDRLRLDGDELDELRRRVAWEPGDLERALELAADEAFADVDYAWIDSERRRLQAVQLELLERGGRLRLDGGDGNGALAAAERLIERDPLNERGWCLAMEAASLLGNRQAILDRYEQLAETLDERLGLRPSGESTALYRRLLAQQ